MAERLKVHAWKACVLHKGTEGSNPSPSATLMFGKTGELSFNASVDCANWIKIPFFECVCLCEAVQGCSLTSMTGVFG